MPDHPATYWTTANVPNTAMAPGARTNAATATLAAAILGAAAIGLATDAPAHLAAPSLDLVAVAPIPAPRPSPELTVVPPQTLAGVATALAKPFAKSAPIVTAGAITAAQPAIVGIVVATAYPAPPPAPAAPPPTVGSLALEAAKTAMGTRYTWGGTSTRGFDCSGLMLWSFKKAGVSLPRTSRAQSAVGRPVAKSDLRPGDLVFFYSPVSHVGLYVGGGKVLHAPQAGDVVKISPMSRMPFHNARRL